MYATAVLANPGSISASATATMKRGIHGSLSIF